MKTFLTFLLASILTFISVPVKAKPDLIAVFDNAVVVLDTDKCTTGTLLNEYAAEYRKQAKKGEVAFKDGEKRELCYVILDKIVYIVDDRGVRVALEENLFKKIEKPTI